MRLCNMRKKEVSLGGKTVERNIKAALVQMVLC